MKTLEITKNQPVQSVKAVPQTSEKAQKLMQKATVIALAITNEAATKAEVKEVTKVVKVAKVVKVKAESMENLAMRLRKQKADEKVILSAFVAAYKVKGIQDINFIKPRLTIYLKIADKRIATTAKAV